MAEARIYYSGELDHNVRLNEGSNVFGTSFDSDIVLFDEAVLDQHFTIFIRGGAANLVVAEGAELQIFDADGNALSLAEDRTLVLGQAHSLTVAKTVIRLSDLPVAAWEEVAAEAGPVKRGKLATLGWNTVTAAGVFVLATVAYLSTPIGGIAAGNANTMSQEASSIPMSAVPAPHQTTTNEIRKSLLIAGFSPDYLQQSEAGFDARFYVGTTVEYTRLRAFLATLDLNMSSKIYVDDAIKDAARLALSQRETAVPDLSVAAGELIIEGAPGDAAWRTEVDSMLRSDIPGLKSITFSGSDEAWKSLIEDNLAAVWAGQNPYIVLTDGRKIRTGQTIAENTVFHGVRGSSVLLVTVNETQEEYELK